MSQRKMIFIAITVVLLAAVLAGCTSPAERTVKAGDNVTIDYILTTSDGKVRDTSYEQVARDAGLYSASRQYKPFAFMVSSGSVIEGFDEAVIGMRAGETKNVTISPEKAYGAYNPELITRQNMSELIAANITPEINATVFSVGYMRNGRIDSIDAANDTVYIDFNHPLAGQTLRFQITVRGID